MFVYKTQVKVYFCIYIFQEHNDLNRAVKNEFNIYFVSIILISLTFDN